MNSNTNGTNTKRYYNVFDELNYGNKQGRNDEGRNNKINNNQEVGFSQEVVESSISEELPIYYYAGHGADYCDPNTRKIVTATVPDNCYYVTFTKCGASFKKHFQENSSTGKINPRDIDLFTSDDYNIQEALKNPIPKQNREIIAENFGIDVDDIRVKGPGDSYVVSQFVPIGYYANESDTFIGPSGLLEKNKIVEIQEKIKYIETKQINLNKNVKISYNKLKSMWIDFPEMIKLYEASVFPTEDQAKEAFKVMFKYNQNKNYTKKQILKSTLDMPFVQENLSNEFHNFTVNDPEAENPFPFVSNTYLMNKFPGIHYWTVCRDVPEDCMTAAIARRTNSNEQQAKHNSIQNAKNKEHQELFNSMIYGRGGRRTRKQRSKSKKTRKNRKA